MGLGMITAEESHSRLQNGDGATVNLSHIDDAEVASRSHGDDDTSGIGGGSQVEQTGRRAGLCNPTLQ